MQHYKPECSVKKIDYCNQGQGHSKGSKCQFCPDDICKTNKHFLTKLGIVMHHHEPECHANGGFAIFKFKVTADSKGSSDNGSFCYIFWAADPSLIKLGLIVHYNKPVCVTMKLDCCLHGLRLFTPCIGSRKQNIFSSNYTQFILAMLFSMCVIQSLFLTRSWF